MSLYILPCSYPADLAHPMQPRCLPSKSLQHVGLRKTVIPQTLHQGSVLLRNCLMLRRTWNRNQDGFAVASDQVMCRPRVLITMKRWQRPHQRGPALCGRPPAAHVSHLHAQRHCIAMLLITITCFNNHSASGHSGQ